MEFLGLVLQLWGVPRILEIIPANCFWPQPKVESCLLKITPHTDAKDTREAREEIIRTSKLFFQNRRKQLLGTLKRSLNVSAEIAAHILKDCGLAASQRPQELSLENWRDVTAALRQQRRERL
jgi:16S rRNA (adenine1518-N6/adenine1519-N6)-dimethyltransferase